MRVALEIEVFISAQVELGKVGSDAPAEGFRRSRVLFGVSVAGRVILRWPDRTQALDRNTWRAREDSNS